MTKQFIAKSTIWSGIQCVHVTERQKCGQTQSHAVSFFEEVKKLVSLTLNFSVMGVFNLCERHVSHQSVAFPLHIVQ